MIIKELRQVSKNKIGCVNRNNVKTEPSEDSTILLLTQFGFNIDLIKPASIKKSKNPDILIDGSIWEIKSPESSNETTIKNRFRKASKQADKVIFDLRGIKQNSDKAKKQILSLFERAGRVRHLMIIEQDEKLLDITK